MDYNELTDIKEVSLYELSFISPLIPDGGCIANGHLCTQRTHICLINLKPPLRPNGGLEDNTFTWLYYTTANGVTTERVLNLEIS